MTKGVYSLEQMQVFMLVAGANSPKRAAKELRQRWRYILGLALAAQRGIELDDAMPQVMLEADDFVARANAILSAIEEWQAGAKV